jgi:3-phenylpropionate/trans-cinnamate dioxygenase ferredoxin subunit
MELFINMHNWQIIDIKKPINNQIIDVNINGIDILITLVDDKLFACKNLCPHEEIKLSLGCIQNTQIKCSLHGFLFDLTTGNCDNTDVDNLEVYEIKQENDKILIKLQ